ncbi:hypothetical protein FQZ97_648430 [compost metagenome]
MTSTELFATAAHLHVLLRRKTGRVTDTEWMATNADYAHEIVRYAREQAATEGHAELLPWAEKLDTLIPQMGAAVRKPLLVAAGERLKAGQTPAKPAGATPGRPSGFSDSAQPSGFLESTLNSVFGTPRKHEGGEPDLRYVGGIR